VRVNVTDQLTGIRMSSERNLGNVGVPREKARNLPTGVPAGTGNSDPEIHSTTLDQ
jgi:hypothetical protein